MDFELLVEALVKIIERREGVKISYSIVNRADVEKEKDGESECLMDANGTTKKLAMGVWNVPPNPTTIAQSVAKKSLKLSS